MLNIISNVSNNVFINKIQYNKSMPSFQRACARDEFVRTTKPEGNRMQDKAEAASNKKSIIDSFAKKKAKLPLCFDMALGSTMGYMQKIIDEKTYTSIFTSEAPFVFQTAEFGVDKEFSQKYANEINLVKQLNTLCGSFKNDECDSNDFNTQVFNAIKSYTQE